MPDVPPRRLARAAGRHVFGTDVEGYSAGRLGYPDELYAAIAGRLGRRTSCVEIGPGTGLATERLTRLVHGRYVAVEPDPALAALLRASFPTITVVEQDFIATPIDGAFDLVAAAASFHWLDARAALAKAHAMLQPGGTIALWWNVYRQTGIGDPFAEAVIPLLADLDLPPSEGAAGHYSLDVDLHRAQLTHAGFGVVDHMLHRRERTLDAAQARALYASYSFVRALAADRRAALLDAIVDLVETRFAGRAPNVVLTPAYFASASSLPRSAAASAADNGKYPE